MNLAVESMLSCLSLRLCGNFADSCARLVTKMSEIPPAASSVQGWMDFAGGKIVVNIPKPVVELQPAESSKNEAQADVEQVATEAIKIVQEAENDKDEDGICVESNIVNVSQVKSYEDIEQFHLAMAYASSIEDRYAQLEVKRLNALDTVQIALVKLSGKGEYPKVIMHVKLGKGKMNEIGDGEGYRLADRVMMTASLKQDIEGQTEQVELEGVALPYGLDPGRPAGHISLVLLKSSARIALRLKMATRKDAALNWLDVKVKIDLNQAPIRRGIAALEKLSSSPHAAKFHRAITLQNPRAMPTTIVGKNNAPLAKLVSHFNRLKTCDWTLEQKKVLWHAVLELKGHVGVIHGNPGVGKSALVACTTLGWLKAEMPVLVAGGTNRAADTLARSIQKVIKDESERDPSLKDKKVLRIYDSSFSGYAWDYMEDQDNKQRDPKPEIQQNYDVSNDEDAYFRMVGQIGERKPSDVVTCPDLALPVHVVDFGKRKHAAKEVLMRSAVESVSFGSNKQQAKPLKKNELVDMYRIFVQGWERNLTEDIRTWSENDVQLYCKARAYVTVACVKESGWIIVTTPNLIGSDLICQNFGAMLEGTNKECMVIYDESSMINPVDSIMWASLTHLKNLGGVVLAGDPKQMKPVLQTAMRGKNKNEWAEHYMYSWFKRLIDTNFPSLELLTNFRSRPELLEFVSRRSYGGRLKAHDTNKAKWVTNPELCKVIRDYLGLNPRVNPDSLFYSLVEIEDSVAIRHTASQSRYNLAHIWWIVGLVKAIISNPAAQPKSWAIICPYKIQGAIMWRVLFMWAMANNIDRNLLPEISTVWGIGGEAREFVILDQVVSDGGSLSDLGFIADEELQIVCHTRANCAFLEVMGVGAGDGGARLRYLAYAISELMLGIVCSHPAHINSTPNLYEAFMHSQLQPTAFCKIKY